MTNIVKELYKKLDILSQKFNFEKDDSNIYRTVNGATLSIITFIAIFVIAILFGKEVFLRENPTITDSHEFIDDVKLNLTEFPFMISAFEDSGNYIDFFNYFDYSIDSLYIDKFGKVSRKTDLVLRECSEINYNYNGNKFNELISELAKNPRYCIFSNNTNHFIWNGFGKQNSSMIRMKLYFCNKETNPECLYNDSLLDKRPHMFIQYIDYIISSGNYKNPIIPYVVGKLYALSIGTTKLHNYIFSKNLYISDNGWLIENKKRYNYISFQNLKNDIEIYLQDISKPIAILQIESLKTQKTSVRSYLKIQELFARIGGIANALLIIANILCYNYLRFKYLVFTWENSFLYLINKKKMSNIFKNESKKEVNTKSITNNLIKSNIFRNIESIHNNIVDSININHSFNQRKRNSHEEESIIDNKFINVSSFELKKHNNPSQNAENVYEVKNNMNSNMNLDNNDLLNYINNNTYKSFCLTPIMREKEHDIPDNELNLNNSNEINNRENINNISDIHNDSSINSGKEDIVIKANNNIAVTNLNNKEIKIDNNDITNKKAKFHPNYLIDTKQNNEKENGKKEEISGINSSFLFNDEISLRRKNDTSFFVKKDFMFRNIDSFDYDINIINKDRTNLNYSYSNYLVNIFFSCIISKTKKDLYKLCDKEIKKVRELLNIKTFKHYLIKAYYREVNNEINNDIIM